MKLRVSRNQRNKKNLRLLVTTRRIRPPFSVLCDASFIRCALEGKVRNLHRFIEDTFVAPCSVWYTNVSVRKLVSSIGGKISLLNDSFLYGSKEIPILQAEERNETKGLWDALKSNELQNCPCVIIASQSHDVRKVCVADRTPMLRITFHPTAAWIDLAGDQQGNSDVPPPNPPSCLSSADRAFLNKVAPNSKSGSTRTQVKRPPLKFKLTSSGVNPLASKKKKVREKIDVLIPKTKGRRTE